MAGLLDPFLRGLGGQQAPPPPPAPTMPQGFKPRREERQTPPLSVVRAEIHMGEDQVFSGQLWDISRSGASISLGRNSFRVLKGAKVMLRLRSRHGPEEVMKESSVRWVDTNHGATFVGLHFFSELEKGSFLETFLEPQGEYI